MACSHPDPCRVWKRHIEIRCTSGRARWLAHGVSYDVLCSRIGGGSTQEALSLFLGSIPEDRHQPQAVDENGARETGIDRAELFGGEHQLNVAEASATIFLGQHTEGDTGAVGFDVGRFGELEGPQGVWLTIGFLHDGGKNVLSELTGL